MSVSGFVGDLLLDVEILLTIFVKKKSAEVGGVGDIADLPKRLWQGKLTRSFSLEKLI